MTAPRFSCEHCGSTIYNVIETRGLGVWVRRRIACGHCGERVTTYEVSEAQFKVFQAAVRSQTKARETAEQLRDIASSLETSHL